MSTGCSLVLLPVSSSELMKPREIGQPSPLACRLLIKFPSLNFWEESVSFLSSVVQKRHHSFCLLLLSYFGGMWCPGGFCYIPLSVGGDSETQGPGLQVTLLGGLLDMEAASREAVPVVGTNRISGRG